MPENSTFIAETKDALRGILALLRGDRAAPRYFDFSPAGVASSFVPVLLIAGIELVLQAITGATPAGGVTRAALQTAIIYCSFIGSSAVLLNMIGRRDALSPFIVTYNWTNAALTLVLPLLFITGVVVALLVAVVVTFLILINIGRLVMTLKPGQIAMLIVVQLIGGTIALLFISALFPMPGGAVPALQ